MLAGQFVLPDAEDFPAALPERAVHHAVARLVPRNFFFQKVRRVAGCVPCCGQPCQKQPSTKSASRACLKTKSGLPKTF